MPTPSATTSESTSAQSAGSTGVVSEIRRFGAPTQIRSEDPEHLRTVAWCALALGWPAPVATFRSLRRDQVRATTRRLVLTTDDGQCVRNRERWHVTDIHPDGALTVSSANSRGMAVLPVDYVREHVRLGYAATEHGHQGDTTQLSIELVADVTTRRGLYVGATRGIEENRILVVTDGRDLDEARDTLERILLGPAHVTDGSENLVGALRQSMAALGARTIREMQRVEMVYAPSTQTEGKSWQRAR